MNINEPLTPEQRDSIINTIAEKIAARRLEAVAVLFLEMNKPLSFIASQSMLVAMPFLAPFIGTELVANSSKLLANRENIDLLISRIEDMAAEKNSAVPLAAKDQR